MPVLCAAKKNHFEMVQFLVEHEVFHAVSTWMEFIKNAGYYTNRDIIHEFD